MKKVITVVLVLLGIVGLSVGMALTGLPQGIQTVVCMGGGMIIGSIAMISLMD